LPFIGLISASFLCTMPMYRVSSGSSFTVLAVVAPSTRFAMESQIASDLIPSGLLGFFSIRLIMIGLKTSTILRVVSSGIVVPGCCGEETGGDNS
jgi:hypothetical protein